MPQQIFLRKINKPVQNHLEEDIEWFCDSFCLRTGRDTGRITTLLVTEILTHQNELSTTELLAQELDMKIGRINHHLRNLVDAGILYRDKRMLFIRGGSMKASVQEIRKDTERILDEIEIIAEEIDRRIGLKNRG
ncbi:ArsR family transcriptional regulator [Candidatus Woesearchaeota archaeon]|nr:ArsR family transcriptional regulator [Candidatus Woesearchaeota archaeon]